MKQKFRLLLITGFIFGSGLLFWTLNTSSAQESFDTEISRSVKNKKKKVTNEALGNKLDALVDQLGKLATSIDKSVNPIDEYEQQELQSFSAKSATATTPQIGHPTGCGRSMSEYKDWPSSLYRKTDTEWSMHDFPVTSSGSTRNVSPGNFLDVNGDGLVDYLHRNRYSGGYVSSNYTMTDGNVVVKSHSMEDSCLLLNNGNGWDIVYKCVALKEITAPYTYKMKYYGDCADTSQ